MNWVPGGLVELETPRLQLRSMTREDVSEDYLNWMADPEVMMGMNLPRRRLSRAQAVRQVLAYDNYTGFNLGIHLNNGAQIGFFNVVCDHSNATAETSVVIGDRQQWGRNIVIEGRSCLLDFLFDELQMHKVTGRVHGRNFASIFNYKALGFSCEAILHEQLRSIEDDSRLDQLIFSMLRTRWQHRRAQLSEEGSVLMDASSGAGAGND